MERRLLHLLRSSEELPTRTIDPADSPETQRHQQPQRISCFADLRTAAKAAGLPIQPLGTPYITMSELLMLGWLAQAQRVAAPSMDPPFDRALRVAIARCAELLNAEGLRLSPSTIYAARQCSRSGGATMARDM